MEVQLPNWRHKQRIDDRRNGQSDKTDGRMVGELKSDSQSCRQAY